MTVVDEDLQMMQYLFDLQGYLVIENALSEVEVAELNAILDEQELPENGKKNRFGSAPDGSGFLAFGKPFCDLLDHPSIMPVLRLRLGDCFRLDRLYGMCMTSGMDRGRLHSDYGASSPVAGASYGVRYHPPEWEMVQGFVVVSWSLTNAGPGVGGFCCIPGSHKTEYRMPKSIGDAGEDSSLVVIPEAPAGSAVLFTEALTHGTADWRAGHQRRTLLYKYCLSQMAWTSRRVSAPENVTLTERQEVLLKDPGDPHRHFPSLFDDEVKVYRGKALTRNSTGKG
ncbi:MAG: phytanoyl-CoA dioxygenase family protein [Candidatus Latescibacterota bacterium]|nr:phytanoyl-CoA dioxygenase family protein [Candidatus Latescibacterota bacterium]